MLELRPLGKTNLRISPVAMGCWPIAGMTSLDVNETDSLATLRAALESGVNFFDTAYCYGANGESERLIAQALGNERQKIVIATKCGIHWGPDGAQVKDGRPATLRSEVEASLRRLRTDYVDLLYLHAPDPATPVEESGGELKRIMDSGLARSVGVSNFNLAQLEAFHATCPITAFQPPYNMLQRQIESDTLPWCRERGVSAVIYWPLMKGLLAGKLARDHQFRAGDGRLKYPMFQGQEWQRNQDFLDELRAIAAECGQSVASVVVRWTIDQPGITAALCGAKRPEQIRESAAAMHWEMTPRVRDRIDAALARRGEAVVRSAVR